MSFQRRTIFPGKAFDEQLNSTPKRKPSENDDISSTPDRLFLSHDPPKAANLPKIIVREDPWRVFTRSITQNQAGDAIIAFSQNASSCLIVAVKKRSAQQQASKRLQRCDHRNLIMLREVYYHEDNLYLVYDRHAMSLEGLLSVPSKPFAAFEIATLCLEVLHGLAYIHTSLGIAYGQLAVHNIALERNGTVKLANIGDSMLEDSPSAKREDVKAIVTIINRMPGDDAIRDPTHSHYRSTQSFIAEADTGKLKILLEHEFLRFASYPSCLVDRALKTDMYLYREWKAWESPTISP